MTEDNTSEIITVRGELCKNCQANHVEMEMNRSDGWAEPQWVCKCGHIRIQTEEDHKILDKVDFYGAAFQWPTIEEEK